MRYRNININPYGANLNKIGAMIPGTRKAVGSTITSAVKTAKGIKAIPGKVKDAPGRLKAWVEKLKSLPETPESTVTDELYHGDLVKKQRVSISPRVTPHGKIGVSLDDSEGYKGEDEYTWANSLERESADINHFLANYLNLYGEPLRTHNFSVMIHNKRSRFMLQTGQHLEGRKASEKDLEAIPSLEVDTGKVRKNMCLFACRNASFPGKTLSTYQWTTHGAERDYPYIASYENIDLTFMCSSHEAIERKFFDSWMNEIIGTNTMNVGYKNDYVTSIDIAMLTPSQEKTLEAKIENAYPVSINEIEFSHEEGQIIEFTVSFAYDKWSYVQPTPPEPIADTRFDF